MNRSLRIAALAFFGAALAAPALAQTVKVTPLGGIDGEFCPQDRALVFEDPNGTRILYDPGRTVAGAERSAAGQDRHHPREPHARRPRRQRAQQGAELGHLRKPDMSVSAMPNSSAVNIALAKKSKIVTGSEMPPFFAAKLKANGGDPAEFDARALRRQRDGRRREHRHRDGDAQQRPRSRLHRRRPRQGDEGSGHRGRRRPGDRLRAAVQQRPRGLPLRRHRHHGRPGAASCAATTRRSSPS